jgi:hypothetical protein
MTHLLAREAWTAGAKTDSRGERGTFAPMAGKYFTYGGDYPGDTQAFGQAD